MLAAERGAAANTLAAYRRDLEGAQEAIGDIDHADAAALASLGDVWADLAPSSLARKCSALRQFYGFLVDEGLREDDPSPALPRPRTRRPLPRLLSHTEVEALLALAEADAVSERTEAVRTLALLELLYGSGLRVTELVSLPLAAVPRDAPFITITGKGGQQRMVPVSTCARRALSRWLAVAPPVPLAREGRPPDPHPAFSDPAPARGARRHRAGKGLAARLAPCLRHPPAGRRGGPAHPPDPARSCGYCHDANLHPC